MKTRELMFIELKKWGHITFGREIHKKIKTEKNVVMCPWINVKGNVPI